jgi:hypothetical protein
LRVEADTEHATSRRTVVRWLLLALGLFVLNFALTFHNVWPTPWIETRYELSIEIAVLLLLLAGYVAVFGALSRRALALLAVLLTIMTAGRYMEVTAPALYGRAINLYWDAQYLPHVAAMLFEVARPLTIAALIASVIALLAGVFLTLRWALTRVAEGMLRRQERRAVTALAAGLVVFYALGYVALPATELPEARTATMQSSEVADPADGTASSSTWRLRTLRFFSLPVSHTYWQQTQFAVAALRGTTALDIPNADPLEAARTPRLGAADVVVQFVESYGATAFDTPSIDAVVAPGRAELAAAVAATGRRVVSAFAESPTFGGGSWLAHSSFMSGIEVRDASTYDLLLTQQRTTLPSLFTALGYRSVALMPGLKNAWPEGRFYRFANIYGATALDYNGPEFGWWRIPDQYALARFAEIEMAPADRAPLFVFFPTISTHMPFRPVPPYQPDWTRVLSSEPFSADVEARLAQSPEWTNLQPAYAEALAYTFTYVSGFLRDHADEKLVWIMLGDHQPAASVTGPGARWDVPVHVITDNDRIITALLAAGFAEGLMPANPVPVPMHELPLLLTDAFAESGTVSRVAHSARADEYPGVPRAVAPAQH